MKYLLLLLAIFGLINISEGQTKIAFEKTTIDVGQIVQGTVITVPYLFINVGDKPFQILHARGSGGGQVPEWSMNVVKPGQSDCIYIKYTTVGKYGQFNKSVLVDVGNGNGYSPADTTITLFIKGVIVEK
jgi:multidrug efflux pump subunit AcrA (membrane-fusion protein)